MKEKDNKDFINNPEHYKQYLDMCNSEAYHQLQRFYHRKTLFDITGIARQENPHSSFIKWLLNPYESHGMNDFPMKRFLETICFAYDKYGQTYLNEDNLTFKTYLDNNNINAKTAKEKLFLFHESAENSEKEQIRKTLMQGNYNIDSCEISREKVLKKQRRADIYIDMTLRINKADKGMELWHLLVFIENKVNSNENEEQTDAYMKYLLNDEKEKNKYIIPIFLYPVTNNDLANAVQAANDDNKSIFPCLNRLFLLMNYQYLLDGVISPCQKAYNDSPVSGILLDYVTCLGKSIEDYIEQANQTTKGRTNKNSKSTVMAVSREEKDWSLQLWNQHQDILLAACGEFSQPMDERFLLRNNSDEQFYRTVLSSVKTYLEEQEKNNEQVDNKEYLNRINDVLKNSKATFYVKQSNDEPWKFASGSRRNETLGALGYVIIRQYIAREMKNSKLSPKKLLEDLRGRFEDNNITHKWLRGIIVTNKELEKKGIQVCPRYYEDDLIGGKWIGCPLSESGNNPVKPNCSDKIKKNNSEFINGESCPCHPSLTSQGVFDEFYTKNDYACFYDFLHCFFVGNWFDDLKKLGEAKTDIKQELENINKSKKGINETFSAIQIGNSDDFIYVARYWGESTLEQLIAALEMGDYVGDDLSKVNKTLDFTMKEVTN